MSSASQQFSVDGNPVPAQHAQIELEIVPDLFVRGFKHRPELAENFCGTVSITRQRHVEARMGFEGKGETFQPRGFGIVAGRGGRRTRRTR